MSAPINIAKETLVELYIERRLPTREIAQMLGISVVPIYRCLRDYGIPVRNSSEAHRGQHNSPRTEFKPGDFKVNGWGITRERKALLGGTRQEIWLSAYLTAKGLVNFVREHKVPIPSDGTMGGARFYSLDFAWPKEMVAVEVDGDSHSGIEERDAIKNEFLGNFGWRVLRFDNYRVSYDTEVVVEEIRGALGVAP